MPIYHPLGKLAKLAARDDVPEYQFNIVAIFLSVLIPLFITTGVCLAYVLWRARKQAAEEAAAVEARRRRLRSHPLNNRELCERLERLQREGLPILTEIVCPPVVCDASLVSQG